MDKLGAYSSDEESATQNKSHQHGTQSETSTGTPKKAVDLDAEWESFEKLISDVPAADQKPTGITLPGPQTAIPVAPSVTPVTKTTGKEERSESEKSDSESNESGSEESSSSEEEDNSEDSDSDSDEEPVKKKKKSDKKEESSSSEEESSGDSSEEEEEETTDSSSSESSEEEAIVIKPPAVKEPPKPSVTKSPPTKVSKSKSSSHSRAKKRSRSRSKSRRSRSRSRNRSRRSKDHERSSSHRDRKRHDRSRERKRRGSDSNRNRSRRSRTPDRRHASHRKRHSRSRNRHRRSRVRSRSQDRHRRNRRRHSRDKGHRPSPSRGKSFRNQGGGNKKPITYKEMLRQKLIEAQKQAAEGKLNFDDMHLNLTNSNEKPSPLPLMSLNPLASMAHGAGNQVTPQQALMQTMAAMHAKAQQLTGVAVPKYYNPAAVNPLKFAEQVKKRKLLWSHSDEKKQEAALTIQEPTETVVETAASSQAIASASDPQGDTAKQWKGAAFIQDQDGKVAAKFRKLMGIKEEESADDNPEDSELIKKQQELFHHLDREYEFARMTTHTHRGIGLGFSSQGMPDMK